MAEVYIQESRDERSHNNFIIYQCNGTLYGALLDYASISDIFMKRNHNNYKHFNQPGVYLLWGYAADERIRVYVGEAGELITRLQNHKNNGDGKQIWKTIGFSPEGACVIIDPTFTKDMLHYLEKELIDYCSFDLGNINRDRLAGDQKYREQVVCINNPKDIRKKDNIFLDHSYRIRCDDILERFKHYIVRGFDNTVDLVQEINNGKQNYSTWKKTLNKTINLEQQRVVDDVSVESAKDMSDTVVNFEADMDHGGKRLHFVYKEKAFNLTASTYVSLYKQLFSTLSRYDAFANAVESDLLLTVKTHKYPPKPLVVPVDKVPPDCNYIPLNEKYSILYSNDASKCIIGRMVQLLEALGIDTSAMSHG